MPPLQQTWQTGWFDAMFPNACAELADPPFSHDVLAEVTLLRMTMDATAG